MSVRRHLDDASVGLETAPQRVPWAGSATRGESTRAWNSTSRGHAETQSATRLLLDNLRAYTRFLCSAALLGATMPAQTAIAQVSEVITHSKSLMLCKNLLRLKLSTIL